MSQTKTTPKVWIIDASTLGKMIKSLIPFKDGKNKLNSGKLKYNLKLSNFKTKSMTDKPCNTPALIS